VKSTGSTSATPAAGPSTPRTIALPRPGASALPINLSLSEDEHSPNRATSESISPHFSKSLGSGQQAQVGGDEDDEEQLYEYFPLSLDDWYVSRSTLGC
jgi:hypothetical protein